MKKQLEKIEQRIERLEPGKVVRLSDFTRNIKSKRQKNEITTAVIMLLQKYGIEYRQKEE